MVPTPRTTLYLSSMAGGPEVPIALASHYKAQEQRKVGVWPSHFLGGSPLGCSGFLITPKGHSRID